MILDRLLWIGLCIGIFSLVVQPPDASAQETAQVVGGPIPHEQVLTADTYEDCGLRKREVDAFVSHRPSPKRGRQATATIEVSYGSNFTPEAREAFERAADIWETHVSSPVPIQIEASFRDLGSGTLAAAGPNNFYGVDTEGDGNADAIVGDALTGAYLGEAPEPEQADIIVNVNSQRDDWHYGQGEAPAGAIDFTTVILHEIGHGLDFLDLFSVENGQGEYFTSTVEGSRVVGIYDRQVVEEQGDGSLSTLTNEDNFSNPSESLGEALTDDRLFFEGDGSAGAAAQGEGPVLPKLYAPSQFQGGSSIAHLDEDTYPFETQDALMTPFINQAETNRTPGPIMCGQFRDMGWPLGPGCDQYFAALFAVNVQEAETGPGGLTLSWSERDDADIQTYLVDRQYFEGDFETIREVDASELDERRLTIEKLGIGVFTFRLRWVRSDGTTGTAPRTVRDTINVKNVNTEESPPDEQERRTVELSWTVPPGTSSDFRYQIERQRGPEGPFEPLATVSQDEEVDEEQERQYTAARQTPGQYEYRVRSQDGSRNAVTSASEAVQIDFEGDVYALGPYPNPVRGRATLDLTAREDQDVTVEVYDALGRRIYAEDREVRAQAPTPISIDVTQWASGMYFLRLRGESSVGETRKMIVVQ
ncbi:MAG: hypothetical protein BRD42_01925 [Bacteroidetes bacterium QS_3_64_15]|nr:MAG: hypothetical protein BRD42_01925 [Bacteroidetes bacterium QS_3_64_15]